MAELAPGTQFGAYRIESVAGPGADVGDGGSAGSTWAVAQASSLR